MKNMTLLKILNLNQINLFEPFKTIFVVADELDIEIEMEVKVTEPVQPTLL
jgi:hypothetical protein